MEELRYNVHYVNDPRVELLETWSVVKEAL
jgi:hypothetical protein